MCVDDGLHHAAAAISSLTDHQQQGSHTCLTPETGPVTPETCLVTLTAGLITLKTGLVTPESVLITPETGLITPGARDHTSSRAKERHHT